MAFIISVPPSPCALPKNFFALLIFSGVAGCGIREKNFRVAGKK